MIFHVLRSRSVNMGLVLFCNVAPPCILFMSGMSLLFGKWTFLFLSFFFSLSLGRNYRGNAMLCNRGRAKMCNVHRMRMISMKSLNKEVFVQVDSHSSICYSISQ